MGWVLLVLVGRPPKRALELPLPRPGSRRRRLVVVVVVVEFVVAGFLVVVVVVVVWRS